MIQLKGKLEMLKTTYAMQDPSQKYMKIKQNIKKLNHEGDEDNMLVYMDQSEDEDELDEAMREQGSDSESEADEEI